MYLKLPLGECVQLEMPAAVPQPGVGVSDFAHARRHRERGSQTDCAFNLCHHLGGLTGCAHPVRARHTPLAVDLNLKHTDGVQQRGHLALINSVGVVAIQMASGILSVSKGRGGIGNLARDWFSASGAFWQRGWFDGVRDGSRHQGLGGWQGRMRAACDESRYANTGGLQGGFKRLEVVHKEFSGRWALLPVYLGYAP